MLAFSLGLLPLPIVFCLSCNISSLALLWTRSRPCHSRTCTCNASLGFLTALLSSGWRECVKLLSVSGFLLLISHHDKISGTLSVNIHEPVQYWLSSCSLISKLFST